MKQPSATTNPEFRCVIEICPKTPGYKGFSQLSFRAVVKALKEHAGARKAFRYAVDRKLVFGFASVGERQEFLWQMADMVNARGDTCERAWYTEADLQP
jgi:hypothetical protein